MRTKFQFERAAVLAFLFGISSGCTVELHYHAPARALESRIRASADLDAPPADVTDPDRQSADEIIEASIDDLLVPIP